jgi:hypothetical protein
MHEEFSVIIFNQLKRAILICKHSLNHGIGD